MKKVLLSLLITHPFLIMTAQPAGLQLIIPRDQVIFVAIVVAANNQFPEAPKIPKQTIHQSTQLKPIPKNQFRSNKKNNHLQQPPSRRKGHH